MKKSLIGPIIAGIAIAVLSVLWVINILSIDYSRIEAGKPANSTVPAQAQPPADKP